MSPGVSLSWSLRTSEASAARRNSATAGEEGSSFQGTIPQALMMMNGPLMAEAVGGRAGSFLANLLDRALAQADVPPETYMVHHLYLAALGRYPSRSELAAAREFLVEVPPAEEIKVLEDLFWALLNSNEFILNH